VFVNDRVTGNFKRYVHALQWLRCCATNLKVAGSIPDDVTGIFHWHNHSDRTLALWSTHPLKEISTTSISWGKGGRCCATNWKVADSIPYGVTGIF